MAFYQDIRYARKVIEKIQKKDIKILFEPLGSYKDLRISLFTDAAFRNSEDKIKSVEGRVIILENPEGKRHVISAKSCTISKVCKSVKTAETRALENGMEKAIGIARMIQEIMTGRKFRKEEEYLTLPTKCVIDSKTLFESIHSTKQVQEVSITILIAWINEQINRGIVEDVMWTDTKKMIADILTKRNVNPENFQKLLTQTQSDVDKKKSEEKIEIHFVDQGMENQTISVPETMSFQEMKQIYLNQNEGQKSKIRLFFDGDRLQDHETPKIVQMENGDTIDVFLEQIGGGKLERDTSKYKEKCKCYH